MGLCHDLFFCSPATGSRPYCSDQFRLSLSAIYSYDEDLALKLLRSQPGDYVGPMVSNRNNTIFVARLLAFEEAEEISLKRPADRLIIAEQMVMEEGEELKNAYFRSLLNQWNVDSKTLVRCSTVLGRY